jgi:hypothetical protein
MYAVWVLPPSPQPTLGSRRLGLLPLLLLEQGQLCARRRANNATSMAPPQSRRPGTSNNGLSDKAVKSKGVVGGGRHCFMYNESLELAARRSTTHRRKDLTP